MILLLTALLFTEVPTNQPPVTVYWVEGKGYNGTVVLVEDKPDRFIVQPSSNYGKGGLGMKVGTTISISLISKDSRLYSIILDTKTGEATLFNGEEESHEQWSIIKTIKGGARREG